MSGAGRGLHRRRHHRVHGDWHHRPGVGAAVMVLGLIGLLLGGAAVVYLVVTLVDPERF